MVTTVCSNKDCMIKNCSFNYDQVNSSKNVSGWVAKDLDGTDACYKVEKFKKLAKFGF